jgi:glycerophosphoryl diester phosphodiesterase
MRRILIACVLALAACGDPAPSVAADSAQAPADLPAFFDCLREAGAVAVSAHRGGPAPGFAENAIPTLENTLRRAPLSFLDVDVAETADGVLVLMHDDRIERTTTGAGAVRDLTMAQLLAFSLGDESGRAVDARAPTLREALEWAEGRAVLELDIKRGVAYEDVIAEVEAAGAMNRVIFITYSVEGAARLARLAPRGMIYTTIASARELDVLERRGVDLTRIVAWTGASAPGPSLVRALAERGVEARFGMFGDNRNYADAIRAGAQIVAVDDAGGAYRDIDATDGVDGYAAAQCVNP